jgi:hypothetical protein
MTRRLTALLLCVVAGCDFSGAKDLGEPCEATDECGFDGECVIVGDDTSHCLPRPPGREERSCNVDSDCTLSDGQLWPVEAECLDGQCRCLDAEVPCNDVDGEADLVLEEETCRCIARGNEGDACFTSHTCEIGLACTSGECRSAPGQAGAACGDDGNCGAGLSCEERRANAGVGVCR